MEKHTVDILLIEDDPDDAEMTIHALKKHNLAQFVVHIDDGVKAFDYLFNSQKDLPSVILLDLKMPKVDGIQILRRLRDDPVKKNTPVIVLISSKQGKNFLESHDLKANAYLIKPVSAQDFLIAL